ncbi:MAG: sigma-70 family RNA polymerase sigma factor [Cyanobacteria bacterium P01_C01_bin.120]
MDSEKSSSVERTTRLDRELWLAVKQGQVEVLGILYDRYAGLVYGIALKVLGNVQEAEDLTQDIFVKLPKSSFNPERGSLKTFIAILTRSRAIDRVRARQRAAQKVSQNLSPELISSATPDALEKHSQQEQGQTVRAALSELSSQEQQLLKLSYYEGLTQANIAEHLNLPLGTVKSKMRRSLIKLRQMLTEQSD